MAVEVAIKNREIQVKAIKYNTSANKKLYTFEILRDKNSSYCWLEKQKNTNIKNEIGI